MGDKRHRRVKVRANRILAEFFDQYYPRDQYPGIEVYEESIGALDVPFLEYWRALSRKHAEVCRSRLHDAECLECDALLRLHPHPIYGTSEQLYRRLYSAGSFEAHGRMTLTLYVLRSPPPPK